MNVSKMARYSASLEVLAALPLLDLHKVRFRIAILTERGLPHRLVKNINTALADFEADSKPE
jgi:hypothetical protein